MLNPHATFHLLLPNLYLKRFFRPNIFPSQFGFSIFPIGRKLEISPRRTLKRTEEALVIEGDPPLMKPNQYQCPVQKPSFL